MQKDIIKKYNFYIYLSMIINIAAMVNFIYNKPLVGSGLLICGCLLLSYAIARKKKIK